MRRVCTRLPRMIPVVSALLGGCFNNVVTLARDDASVIDPSMNPDASVVRADVGPIPGADVALMPGADVAPMPGTDVPSPPPTDAPIEPAPDAPPTGVGGAGSVDLLVVMDTSNSMRAAQEYFHNNASTIVNGLIDLGVRDVRVGVVSTDLGVGGYVIPSCGVRGGDDAVMNPRVRGASTSARTLPEAPTPFYCEGIATAPFMTLRASEDPMYRYWAPSCHAALGIGGCGLEQPLEAALRALTVQAQPGRPNAGFLRPEAVLAVLVVSDEDDGSVRDCTAHDGVGTCTDATTVWDASSARWASQDLNLRFYQYTPGSAQDPTWPIDRYVDPQRLNRGLLALKPGHPERVVFGAITGVPLNLPGDTTSWVALLGAAADGSDGYVSMSPEGPVSMRARNADPNCPSRVVPACRAEGTAYDPTACDPSRQAFAWPARRLAEVARRLDEARICGGTSCRNGMVASICNTRDSSPLSRFAGMIARRVVR